MPAAHLPELDIYYEVMGRGEPVLLAQPSWWPCDTWKVCVTPRLARRFTTIVFDPRGTGRSDKPDRGYTVSTFAQDALSLLDHLGVSRCHAVGFALGGQIVQAAAIERPHLFETLTLAAVGAGGRTRAGALGGASADEVREIGEHGFERFIRGHIENTHMAFSSTFYRDHSEVVMALSQALWQGQSTPEQFGCHSAARRTWDTLANAVRVTAPAMVLCGAADDVDRGGRTPAETARLLAELIPGAELRLLPGVKHMTFWDGGQALDVLEEFLLRHPIRTVD